MVTGGRVLGEDGRGRAVTGHPFLIPYITEMEMQTMTNFRFKLPVILVK